MGTRITPYVTPEEEAKKNQVARMFDGIAHRYDFLNHFFSLGIDVLWRKACIRMLREESPSKLLDVATGTADFAIEAVRMGPTFTSRASTSARACWMWAARRLRHAGGTQEAHQGDSVALPEDDTFDVHRRIWCSEFRRLARWLGTCSAFDRALGLVLEFSSQAFPHQAGVWPLLRTSCPRWANK